MRLNKISLPIKNRSQKVSSHIRKEAPPCIRMEGSYMVELAVLLPFFAGLMVVLLFYFRVLMVHQEVGNALLASGRELAVLASSGDEGDVVSTITAKALLLRNLKSDSTTEEFVSGGRKGISLKKSNFSGEYIDLQADYKLPLPIGLFGKQSIAVSQRLKCRKWIGGLANAGNLEEEIVYITPNGTVYHRDKNCKSIRFQISSVAGESVEKLRNADGAKYYACSACMKNKSQKNRMVYITKYGNRFHSSSSCSRIGRTVIAVPIREVGKRPACSRCGRE